MSRAVCALTALLLAAGPAPGVDAQGFGLMTGLTFGDVSDDDLLPGDIAGRNGLTLLVSAFTPGQYAVGFDLLYSQRGVVGVPEPESREIDYLDLPVLFRVSAPAGRIAPFIVAGPQISYEIDCDAGPAACQGERPTWPWSAVVGAGFRLGTEGGLAASVETRFIHGFTDLNLRPPGEPPGHRERSFMVLAGIVL